MSLWLAVPLALGSVLLVYPGTWLLVGWWLEIRREKHTSGERSA